MKLLQSARQQEVRLENVRLDFNRLLKRFHRVAKVTLAKQVETQKVQKLSRFGLSFQGVPIRSHRTRILPMVSVPHSRFSIGIGLGLRLEFSLQILRGHTFA
jgi:hypothetical protein